MVKICSEKYPDNSKYSSYFDEYSFPLSDFQKYAIEAIVENRIPRIPHEPYDEAKKVIEHEYSDLIAQHANAKQTISKEMQNCKEETMQIGKNQVFLTKSQKSNISKFKNSHWHTNLNAKHKEAINDILSTPISGASTVQAAVHRVCARFLRWS